MGCRLVNRLFHQPSSRRKKLCQGRKGRLRLKKIPEMTLDRTVRLLKAALAEPVLTISSAILLVNYHIRRNAIAKRSHAKTWRIKHKDVQFLLL